MSSGNSEWTPVAVVDPAQERLASRRWRLRHSAWLLAPVLGLGVLTWIGFGYIALRTKTRSWWIAAAVYLVLGVGAVAEASTEGSAQSSIAGSVLLSTWLGGIIHGIFQNRRYLRWRASTGPGQPWYAQPIEQREREQEPLTSDPDNPFSADTQAYYGPSTRPEASTLPPPAPAAHTFLTSRPIVPPGSALRVSVDANTATVDDFAGLPGLDEAWGHHIVAVRTARGGFRSIDDFVADTGLQPHQFVKLRPLLTLSPIQDTPSPHEHRGGRILDL